MNTSKFLTTLIILMTIPLLSACGSPSKTLPDPSPESPSEQQSEVLSSDDPIWGQASAPVKLVVFADFQCPYCSDLHENLNGLEDLVATGKVLVQYRDYPISSHLNSLSAHTAASAAHAQGKYLEMQSKLYDTQFEWADVGEPERYFAQLAEELGMDMQQYSSDYNNLAARDEIQEDRDAGRDAGVLGTPAFFLNNEIYQGALSSEELREEVTKALNS